LDAGEVGVDGVGHGLDREGLREARDSLDEDVPVGEQAHEDAVHDLLLAHDHAGDLALELRDEGALLGDLLVDFLDP
jgi:hypothetical protein